LALGTLGSSLARSQIIAAILGAAILVSLLVAWLLASVTEPPFSNLFAALALHNAHFPPFQSGQVHLRDVTYYLLVTWVALFATTRVLEARRWRWTPAALGSPPPPGSAWWRCSSASGWSVRARPAGCWTCSACWQSSAPRCCAGTAPPSPAPRPGPAWSASSPCSPPWRWSRCSPGSPSPTSSSPWAVRT